MDEISEIVASKNRFKEALKRIVASLDVKLRIGFYIWTDEYRIWQLYLCVTKVVMLEAVQKGRKRIDVELIGPSAFTFFPAIPCQLADGLVSSLFFKPKSLVQYLCLVLLGAIIYFVIAPAEPESPEPNVGDWPPPLNPFVPIPKTELGSCARSDSLIYSLVF